MMLAVLDTSLRHDAWCDPYDGETRERFTVDRLDRALECDRRQRFEALALQPCMRLRSIVGTEDDRMRADTTANEGAQLVRDFGFGERHQEFEVAVLQHHAMVACADRQ